MKITTSFEAVAIIEGFAEHEPTYMETLHAWAFLIKSGQVWKLQGFYGRGATELIEQGWITKEGEVNMTTVRQWEEAVDNARLEMIG